MTRAFLDTAFFVAALQPRDSLHEKASLYLDYPFDLSVTTEYVLVETANFFSQSSSRAIFIDLVRDLTSAGEVLIIPSSSDLFSQGMIRFEERPDKDWSLTDCISFLVMEEMEIFDALTSDHHFEQAGFRALLK